MAGGANELDEADASHELRAELEAAKARIAQIEREAEAQRVEIEAEAERQRQALEAERDAAKAAEVAERADGPSKGRRCPGGRHSRSRGSGTSHRGAWAGREGGNGYPGRPKTCPASKAA